MNVLALNEGTSALIACMNDNQLKRTCNSSLQVWMSGESEQKNNNVESGSSHQANTNMDSSASIDSQTFVPELQEHTIIKLQAHQTRTHRQELPRLRHICGSSRWGKSECGNDVALRSF